MDRAYQDRGITRADAWCETRKAFWSAAGERCDRIAPAVPVARTGSPDLN